VPASFTSSTVNWKEPDFTGVFMPGADGDDDCEEDFVSAGPDDAVAAVPAEHPARPKARADAAAAMTRAVRAVRENMRVVPIR
jgi:hypothetical protein